LIFTPGGAHLANGNANAAVEVVRQALTIEPDGYEAILFMGFYLLTIWWLLRV